MRRIDFSDVGVVINSMEELDELYMTYTALDISFSGEFREHSRKSQEHNLVVYYLQYVRGDLNTMLLEPYLYVSIIKYPMTYIMDSLEFAAAYHLLKSNQTDELKAHLDKCCKEYK